MKTVVCIATFYLEANVPISRGTLIELEDALADRMVELRLAAWPSDPPPVGTGTGTGSGTLDDDAQALLNAVVRIGGGTIQPGEEVFVIMGNGNPLNWSNPTDQPVHIPATPTIDNMKAAGLSQDIGTQTATTPQDIIQTWQTERTAWRADAQVDFTVAEIPLEAANIGKLYWSTTTGPGSINANLTFDEGDLYEIFDDKGTLTWKEYKPKNDWSLTYNGRVYLFNNGWRAQPSDSHEHSRLVHRATTTVFIAYDKKLYVNKVDTPDLNLTPSDAAWGDNWAVYAGVGAGPDAGSVGAWKFQFVNVSGVELNDVNADGADYSFVLGVYDGAGTSLADADYLKLNPGMTIQPRGDGFAHVTLFTIGPSVSIPINGTFDLDIPAGFLATHAIIDLSGNANRDLFDFIVFYEGTEQFRRTAAELQATVMVGGFELTAPSVSAAPPMDTADFITQAELDTQLADYLTKAEYSVDLTQYLKSQEAADTYQPKGDYATNKRIDDLWLSYATQSWVNDQLADINGVINTITDAWPDLARKSDIPAPPDLAPYLKSLDAAASYQPKGDYALKSDIVDGFPIKTNTAGTTEITASATWLMVAGSAVSVAIAAGQKKPFFVRNVDGRTYTINAAAGETIMGGASLASNSAGELLFFALDGTNWLVNRINNSNDTIQNLNASGTVNGWGTMVIIGATAPTADLTITLPTAQFNAGKKLTLARADNTAFKVTLAPQAGQTLIAPNNGVELNSQNGCITLEATSGSTIRQVGQVAASTSIPELTQYYLGRVGNQAGDTGHSWTQQLKFGTDISTTDNITFTLKAGKYEVFVLSGSHYGVNAWRNTMMQVDGVDAQGVYSGHDGSNWEGAGSLMWGVDATTANKTIKLYRKSSTGNGNIDLFLRIQKVPGSNLFVIPAGNQLFTQRQITIQPSGQTFIARDDDWRFVKVSGIAGTDQITALTPTAGADVEITDAVGGWIAVRPHGGDTTVTVSTGTIGADFIRVMGTKNLDGSSIALAALTSVESYSATVAIPVPGVWRFDVGCIGWDDDTSGNLGVKVELISTDGVTVLDADITGTGGNHPYNVWIPLGTATVRANLPAAGNYTIKVSDPGANAEGSSLAIASLVAERQVNLPVVIPANAVVRNNCVIKCNNGANQFAGGVNTVNILGGTSDFVYFVAPAGKRIDTVVGSSGLTVSNLNPAANACSVTVAEGTLTGDLTVTFVTDTALLTTWWIPCTNAGRTETQFMIPRVHPISGLAFTSLTATLGDRRNGLLTRESSQTWTLADMQNGTLSGEYYLAAKSVTYSDSAVTTWNLYTRHAKALRPAADILCLMGDTHGSQNNTYSEIRRLVANYG